MSRVSTFDFSLFNSSVKGPDESLLVVHVHERHRGAMNKSCSPAGHSCRTANPPPIANTLRLSDKSSDSRDRSPYATTWPLEAEIIRSSVFREGGPFARLAICDAIGIQRFAAFLEVVPSGMSADS
jgi:hypothetical protein